MLVLEGVVFLRDHLYCCNDHMDESNGIQKLASLNLAHACRYSQQMLVQGGLPPRLMHSPSYSPASVGLSEGVISFDYKSVLRRVV